MAVQKSGKAGTDRALVWKDYEKTSYVCGRIIGISEGIYGVLLNNGEYVDVPEYQLSFIK